MNTATFTDLLTAAKRGEWDYVDDHLTDTLISKKDFAWARDIGIVNPDRNVRDFAATVLMKGTSGEISVIDWQSLQRQMKGDEYDIVRFRIAMALYSRGDRTEATVATVCEATESPDVGELARECLKKR